MTREEKDAIFREHMKTFAKTLELSAEIEKDNFEAGGDKYYLGLVDAYILTKYSLETLLGVTE